MIVKIKKKTSSLQIHPKIFTDKIIFDRMSGICFKIIAGGESGLGYRGYKFVHNLIIV